MTPQNGINVPLNVQVTPRSASSDANGRENGATVPKMMATEVTMMTQRYPHVSKGEHHVGGREPTWLQHGKRLQVAAPKTGVGSINTISNSMSGGLTKHNQQPRKGQRTPARGV